MSNEVFAASPAASGHSAEVELLAVDVVPAECHQQLHEIERALLRLAGEAHRHAVADELESAERPDPQPERPGGRRVGGRREQVALDQHRHEFGLDPVEEREIGETRGEIRPIAQEHDLSAGPVIRQHDGEALGGARRQAGGEVFVDQHELALLHERRAVDARTRRRSPPPWPSFRRRDRPP